MRVGDRGDHPPGHVGGRPSAAWSARARRRRRAGRAAPAPGRALPSSRMSTSMPVRIRNGASSSLSAGDDPELASRSRSGVSPLATVSRGEWSVSAMYVVAEVARRLGHLADRRAAVGPVRVGVQSPRSAARRAAPPAATGRAPPVSSRRRYAGHPPAAASVTTAAVASPTPLSSVSVPASARSSSSPVREAVERRGRAAEGPHPVGRLVRALEQERDPPQRSTGSTSVVLRACQVTTSRATVFVEQPARVATCRPGPSPTDCGQEPERQHASTDDEPPATTAGRRRPTVPGRRSTMRHAERERVRPRRPLECTESSPACAVARIVQTWRHRQLSATGAVRCGPPRRRAPAEPRRRPGPTGRRTELAGGTRPPRHADHVGRRRSDASAPRSRRPTEHGLRPDARSLTSVRATARRPGLSAATSPDAAAQTRRHEQPPHASSARRLDRSAHVIASSRNGSDLWASHNRHPPVTRTLEWRVQAARRPSAGSSARSGTLSTAAIPRMDETLPWYRSLPPEERSWVGLVAQAGIAAFVEWFRDPGPAPRHHRRRLRHRARASWPARITLQQTVELIRAHDRRRRGARRRARRARRRAACCARRCCATRREIAFAAAQVYAQAAEARGAWDARLEALVVDALLRGEVDEACGPGPPRSAGRQRGQVAVVVGRATRRRARGGRRRRPARRPARSASTCSPACRATGWSSCSAASPTRSLAARALLGQFAPGPGRRRPGRRRPPAAARRPPRPSPALRAASAWPDAPRPVLADDLLPERALAGDAGARARLVEDVLRPLADAGGDLLETARRVPRAGRVARGRGPGAVRPPEHRALPAAPGRRRDRRRRRPTRAARSPCGSRWPSAGSTPAATGRSFVGNLQDPTRRTSCRGRYRSAAPVGHHGGGVLVIVAPGQGAQTPGFLAPWLELPGVRDAPALALGVRRPRPRALRHRGRRRRPSATPRSPSRCSSPPGWCPLLELFPHPADAFGVVGVGAGHSVGEITAAAAAHVITAEQAMVLVRERGRAMAAAAAVTPTGMTAVLGGDPDDVLAKLAEHGLTAGQRQRRRPDRRRRHARAARGARGRPARGRAAAPAAGRRRVPHRAHGARGRHARQPRRAPSPPTTRAPGCSPTATAPSSTTAARCSRRIVDQVATRSAGTCACRPWATSASPASSSCRRPARSSAWPSAPCPASRPRPQDARRPRGRPRPGRAARHRQPGLRRPRPGGCSSRRPRARSAAADAGGGLGAGSSPAAVGRSTACATSSRSSPRTAVTSSSGSSRTATRSPPVSPLVRLHPEAVPA